MLRFVWHFETKNVLQKFQVMGTCLPTCLEVFEILLPEFEHWPVGQRHKVVSGIMSRSRLKSYPVILCVHFSDCIFFVFVCYQGERLSHAVGCAFAICLERKQKRDKESGVNVTYNQDRTSFTRTGSFRQASITERIADPQSAILAGNTLNGIYILLLFPFFSLKNFVEKASDSDSPLSHISFHFLAPPPHYIFTQQFPSSKSTYMHCHSITCTLSFCFSDLLFPSSTSPKNVFFSFGAVFDLHSRYMSILASWEITRFYVDFAQRTWFFCEDFMCELFVVMVTPCFYCKPISLHKLTNFVVN